MADGRSLTAPAGRNYDDASDDGSVPSTLYARCDASVSRALNARRLRMAAENDVTFLKNRLSKLKHEELKAKQEVDKLKQKADEVSAIRSHHENTQTERHDLQDQVDYGKRKEAALIALNRERQAKAVWASKQKVMTERREAVLGLRKEKEINECRVHILREELRDKNTRQRESIKQLHDLAKQRRQKEADAKREEVRLYHEQKIEQEEQERLRKEKLAAQLVAQEAQMIYRLKKLHSEKQNALRQLAQTIEGSVPREQRSGSLPPIQQSQ